MLHCGCENEEVMTESERRVWHKDIYKVHVMTDNDTKKQKRASCLTTSPPLPQLPFSFFFSKQKPYQKEKKRKNMQKINKKDFGIWGLVFCCARVHVWCLWLIKARMCVCVYMFTPELIIWLLSRSEAHVKLCPGSGSEKAQFSAVVVRL